ncbi:MAG: N-6 DNA methylase [Labilibaculum sp.]|nr:TaqI-like C-terminal specificity domain-containing protein [Labilibaculum sp.]MBI9060269.1 N-6 DNA methylase [Labilibaculum sp.]
MMGIFQKSVIKNHLKTLDSGQVEKAYQKFRENYNSAKIEEIKNLKEEEYQSEFLREIFVDVLGYTLRPSENYNLALEFKNQGDSKKADGAILKDGKAIAVIELKSTKTKDLKSVTEQAFGYKHNQPDCKYVIISNFQKLQFYIDYANEYEEFDLFNLQRDEFELLYLLLNVESIFNDLPLKLKNETKFHEENISNKLYKDYSIFRDKLFENLIKNNPDQDKLTLFKKSQKLLDRFLFILFAEDSLLLPTNSITRIIETFNKLEELDAYKPIYDIFKQYFGYMNDGRKGKTYADDIPAYNGGLFYPDELLDKLIIDDDVLIADLLKLSTYDFNTEVDVNILGHIFEHSLSEIEEIAAEIEGTATDKTKSKRKKDGIFYTPKYITQYIVENTIGTLCKEKRKEFEIVEIEFDGSYKIKDGTLSAKGKKLFETLEAYKKWLLTLKIVDPACGSGAFLNQALNFLIAEHKSIDDIIAELTNTPLRLFDTEKSILENNLYGVDINEESVEIAKLSLWLRTAHRDRKLSNLNSNIKCGNSLIDDPEVAGDKAFDWNKEFKEIMGNGGFDVVIGNPPYVSNWTLSDSDREMVLWLSKKYDEDLTGHWDLFICFISISIKYLKEGGYNSFILPTSFLKEKYGRMIREKIIDFHSLVEIIDFGEEVIFENVARQTFIYNIRKVKNPSAFVKVKHGIDDKGVFIPQQFFKKLKNTTFKTNVNSNEISVFNKLNINSFKLGEILCVNVGVVAHSKLDSPKKFKKDDVIYKENKEGFKKYIIGSNMSRYSLIFDKEYLDYDSNVNYFHRPKFKLLFESEKIIIRRTSGNNNSIFGVYDNQNYYSNDSLMHLIRWSAEVVKFQKPENKWDIDIESQIDLKFVLAILCSKVLTFYFSKFLSTDTLQGAYSSIYPEDLRDMPIRKIDIEKQLGISKSVDKMLELNKQFQQKKNEFLSRVKDNFSIEKTSNKLEAFYNFDFKTFVAEVEKQKRKVTLTQQVEWEEFFNTYKAEINNLQNEINQTDKTIDQMVYELYGLTEEEIEIVEGN